MKVIINIFDVEIANSLQFWIDEMDDELSESSYVLLASMVSTFVMIYQMFSF